MKIITPIMVVTMVIVSNSLFAQDSTHTKLVDKYYPESKAPEPPVPILDKATSEPLNTTLNKPSSSTVSEAPRISPTVSQPPPQISSNVIQSPQINKVASTTVPETPISQIPIIPNNIYNDTRLGSSAPENDSYIKNDNGAGSITTNPNKGNGTNVSNPSTNSNAPVPIYRDTRLGSSSPLYNTYEKNDNGAGSITTNPNKG